MKKIYLHAGLDKTGTTSIQSIARNNHEALKSLGVYYPPLGAKYGNTSGGLHSIPMEIMHSSERRRPESESLRRLLAEFEESGVETLFISSERSSGFADRELRFVRSSLKGYDVTPIFVTRHPIAHRISQMSSRGNVRQRDIGKFFHLNNSWRCGSKVALWRKYFPKTIILRYEEYGDISAPIFDLITGGHFSSLSATARRRESLPVDLAMLNLELRAFFPVDEELYRTRIYNHLFALQDSDEYRAFRPDPKQKLLPIRRRAQEAILASFKDEIAELSSVLGKSCDDYLVPIEGHFVGHDEIEDLKAIFAQKFLPEAAHLDI